MKTTIFINFIMFLVQLTTILVSFYLSLEAHLLEFLALVEALHALLHEEERDTVCTRLGLWLGDSHHDHHVRHVAVGDERF